MRAALPTDLPACCESDLAFHAGVIAAATTSCCGHSIGTIEAALRSSFLITGELMRAPNKAIDAHHEVLECIRLRDPAGARRAMNQLLDIAAEDLQAI
jgi:DNA-binding FadR family transcriptional regulator